MAQFDRPRPDLSRVAVVGTSGAGKTTLAKTLARRLSVPHIELDALHWMPGWRERDDAAFRVLAERATAAPRWVACGNYAVVRDLVWSRATTVVWLDYGFPRVLWRSVSRTLRRCLTREVLFSNNRESFVMSFLSRDSIILWTITSYPKVRRVIRADLDGGAYGPLDELTCRNPREAQRFLDHLPVAAC